MKDGKPFNIPKQAVWTAYKKVKANQGSAGIDGQSLTDFEKDLQNNLYKIWNRMSSGSYVPPPVKAVEIPKKAGGTRRLGIPTVSDRIAQMVAKMYMEPYVEMIFHEDSYGYRPNKSALDAVGKARQRCWKYDYVIEFDIRGLFDNIDHKLLMKAVRKHVKEPWTILYIERWLKTPFILENGDKIERKSGTPQGGD
jgi:group II intron reverse transcriptase/maturase